MAQISEQPPLSGNPIQDIYLVADKLIDQEYQTYKLSGGQLAGALGLIKFPTDTLTPEDVGKLVMNKDGKAVVATRDTTPPAQLGQWRITVNNVFEMPIPSTVQFTFTGQPAEGDYVVLGLQRYVFKATPKNKYDIEIGVDVVTTIANATLVFNNTHPDQWTASDDGASVVSVVFDSIYETGLANPLNNLTFGLFYNISSPDQVDVASNNITLSIPNPGDTKHIRDFDNPIFYFGGGSLNFYDVSNPFNGTPNGTELYGVKWAQNINDQAENIAYGINNYLSNVLTASVNNNIITINAVIAPEAVTDCDIVMTDAGNRYMELETVKPGIASNADFIVNPVLGLLAATENNTAIINSSSVMELTLGGTAGVDITDTGTDLTEAFIEHRLLLVANDGGVESLTSFNQTDPAPKFDKWLINHLLSENLFWAISSAIPGNKILAVRQVPPVALKRVLSAADGK